MLADDFIIMLKLSGKEKILLHLEDHIDEQLSITSKELEPPQIFSQSGIEESINLSHRIVSEGLKELKKAVFVEEKRIYLRATGRFRNFYFLTSEGITKAMELKEQLDKIKLTVKHQDKTKEMKFSELIDYLKEICIKPIDSGYSYMIGSEKREIAYKVFENLVGTGYKGIVISNVPPKNIEKEYMVKSEIYWLSELEGENIFRPDRLDFEITAAISNFLKENKKPVIILEGVGYLVQINGFNNCLRWIKTVNDMIARHDGILLMPIAPEIFDKKELSLLLQNTKLYVPSEQRSIEINYTNILTHITPEGYLNLSSILAPKKYVDFSERKPEVKYFVGREQELKEILSFINSKANVLVLKGIAGIGKTALISKLLERYKLEMNIFWHRFYNFSTLRSMLIKLSDFLATVGSEKLRNYMSGERIDIEEIIMLLEEELKTIEALLIFDNFERANTEIVNFFLSLKELKTNSRIMVIGRSIAPFYDRGDVVVQKHVVELNLAGLDRESCEKLLKYRGIEKDIDRFYNLTKGHPLMLELILPETTVEAEKFLKEEIIKALNECEKKAVEIASVFRVPFYPRALFIEDIDYDTIDELVDKSLLQRSQNIYDLHELLRESIYNRLTPKQKNYYHMIAAEYYEKEKSDFAVIEAMYHYLSADNQEKAAGLAVENGSTIIKGGYLEEFMSVLTEFKPEKIQKEQYTKILIFTGDISNLLGRWDDAINYYHSSLELSSETKNDLYAAEAHRGIAKIHLRRAEYDKTLHNLQTALAISDRVSDIYGVADAHYNIASVKLRKGELNEALKELELGLELGQKIGDTALIAKLYGTMGVAYWSMGEYDKSIELMLKGMAELKEVGDRHELVKIYNNLGTAYEQKGELDKAIEWYEQCVKISNEIGDVRMAGYGLCNVAEAYTKKFNLDRAKDYTDKALKIFERLAEKRTIAQCKLNYGIIYSHKGEWDEAVAYFENAIKLANEMEDPEFPSQIYFQYGKMYKAKGDKARAKILFEKAMVAYQQLDNLKKVEEVKKEIEEL